jgi:DNA-binding transcriptional MocR family regulator
VTSASNWRLVSSRQTCGGADHRAGCRPPARPPCAARHLGVSRGVRADPADIIITNGIQQAIDLIGRVMLDQGACAAVEDPGYPPPRRLLESLGARVVAVPVDQEGLVVDALPDDARLVYCSPSHQFPLGMAMSLGRRIPLLAWAAQKGAAIIEDGTVQDMLNVLRAQAAGISLFPLSDLYRGPGPNRAWWSATAPSRWSGSTKASTDSEPASSPE